MIVTENQTIGVLTKKVIDILSLDFPEGTKILFGDTNKTHIKDTHPDDYMKYGKKIAEIIEYPTFICKHPENKSIEYIKIFKDSNNENDEYVLVAVRSTASGILFARTLFVMAEEKILKYKDKNALIPY